MDAFERMAGVLGSIKKTPEQRRAEKNRRYYELHRERFGWVHHAVIRLFKLRDLLA